MLRRMIYLLCALVLTGCTLAPEVTPAPVPTCPVCPTAVTCPTSAPASAPVCTPLPQPTAVPTEIPTQEPSPLATETQAPTTVPTAEAQVPAPQETAAPAAEPHMSAPEETSMLVPYVLQQGTPTWMPSFNHPDRGCNWMGVAGQVLDADGIPVRSIVVQVDGFIDDQPISAVGLTGSVTAYGQGGYEIELYSQPVDTTGQLSIQLFNLDGEPLSDPVLFDTYGSCSENLVLVNFKAAGD